VPPAPNLLSVLAHRLGVLVSLKPQNELSSAADASNVPHDDARKLCWSKEAQDVWSSKSPVEKQSSKQHVWKTSTTTPLELEFMQLRGSVQDKREADAIRTQIEEVGIAPEQSLSQAVASNRLVGFSDMHVRQGPYFQFLIDDMSKLKSEGVSDLAVEVPQPWQSKLDNWSKDDQSFLRPRLTDGSSLLNVIDAAKQNGIKVTAVDELYTGAGDMILSRDRTMADKLQDMLKTHDSKILYLVGAEHLASGFRRNTDSPTTAQILRDRNIPISTFYQQLPSMPDGLMMLTHDLAEPTAVKTNNASLVSTVRTAAPLLPGYGKWDNVIFYPPHYKMEKIDADLAHFGTAPEESMKNALQQNQVLLLGEMRVPEPELINSEHRQYMAQTIPALKEAGLTDFALDVPSEYQGVLNQLMDKGIPDGPLELPEPYGGYSSESFKPVLDAAIKAHLRLHAIGQNYSYSTPMKTLLDGLTDATEKITRENANSKALVWTQDDFVAKFTTPGGEVSVADELKSKGVTATSFADFSPFYDKFSPTLISGLLDKPTAFKPQYTDSLKEVLNSSAMQMDRFDNVILYPSK
jgi:hypothetical protein